MYRRRARSPRAPQTTLRIRLRAFDADGDAPDITAPTLVIHSPLDSRVGFEHGEYIAGVIPGAELFVVENESHYSTLNDAAISRIKSFLRGLT